MDYKIATLRAVGRAGLGAGLGLAMAPYENQHLLGDDASPGMRYTNTALLALTGALGLSKGTSKLVGPAAAGALWAGKMPLMMGANAINRFTDVQKPIADTNLETAKLNQQTATAMAERAKGMTPTDLGAMGLGAAGLAGAGGLAYYLYKTLGPGKKKPSPKVTVNLPMTRDHGNVSVESDLDALTLSQRLYKSLKRDTRRQFLDNAKEHTVHPHKKQAHALLFELPATPALDRVLSLLEIV